MPDITAFTAEVAGLEQSTNSALLRQKSRDFYWYSPILKRQLDGKRADIWLRPQNEDEVMRILNAARRHGVPVTVRGGATGNYGQCVPLNGGAVLDTTAMTAPISLKDGVLEAEAGARMIDLDLWARERGWELRLWPSTKRTATIAGSSAMAPCANAAIFWVCVWPPCKTRPHCSTWKVMRRIQSIAPMAPQA